MTQLQVEVTLSSPPAALSLAELLWSVERESELELGLSLDGAPVAPRSRWAPTGANLRPELWMGTPAAPVAESDPSAPLSSNPSQLTPAQRRLKDMLAEISRPLEMDFERPVMFAQGQSRLCADDSGFDFERWRLHTSPSRYIRLLGGSFFGVTFRRVLPAVLVLALLSWLSCIYEQAAFADPTLFNIRLPILLFELTAPALTLLLVFRSDNSYSRFKDGSIYLWEITTSIRSYIRRLVGWTSSSRTTADERVATEQIILACCLLHQWIMNEFLRDNGPMHEQLHGRKVHEDLLCAALGVASSSEIIDAEDNPTPYLGLTAIIIGATKRLPSLTDQERVGLEDELGDVASNLGQCERILRQPIPLGYERSTVRFLWMWLLLLPFALVPTFADMGWPQETWSSLVIGTVTFLSVVFLCVEDIAVQIEQPFGILPLDLCHNWLMRDVARSRRLLNWSSYECGDGPP